MEWHQRLQKLNQQAVVEASCVREEYVKEALTTFGKVGILQSRHVQSSEPSHQIPVLVHEVVLIDLWKHKVLPRLLKLDPEPEGTFLAYSILYHEAVCVGLLELVMFHGSAAEALADSAHDLADYAYGAVSQLLVVMVDGEEQRELVKQRNDLCFDIGIRCLSVLRYLAEHLDRLDSKRRRSTEAPSLVCRLPLGVAAAMYDNDVPVLLVQVLLAQPWIKGGDQQYRKGRWVPWDREAVTPAAAQVPSPVVCLPYFFSF